MANRIKVAIASSIIVLREQGWSFRGIARALGIHRETVARYVRRHEAESKPATNPPAGKGAGVDSKPANPPPGNPGPRSRCEPFRDAIKAKLDQGLSAQRIWRPEGQDPGAFAPSTPPCPPRGDASRPTFVDQARLIGPIAPERLVSGTMGKYAGTTTRRSRG